MKFLQGLNLESEISTFKIEIGDNSEELIDLLELIDGFHPIFIKDYVIEDGTLSIRSKLTGVWRNSIDTLEKLSNGEIQYEEAKAFVVDEVIKRRVKSMSTIPLLQAAQKLGHETTLTVLDEQLASDHKKGYGNTWNRYYTIGCGKGSQITGSIASSKDSSIGKNIQRDKWSTNQMISRLGLPIAKWQVVDEIEDIDKIWDEYEKPVVIKPTGLTGGKGVTVGIDSIEKARKAFRFAKEQVTNKVRQPWQTKVMIQEQIQGDTNGADYRLLVVNGKLRIATKRIPAFIIGDGKSTIEQIINEMNKDPRRDVYNPAHVLKPIEIDEPLKNFLEEQNLKLDSVLAEGEKIYVRKVSSMSRGGVTEDFTDKVSPEIKYVVESIAQSMHAFVIGADIMCKDISKPLTKDNGGILEVNTMPEAYLNFYPTIGESREYIAEEYIKELLQDCKTKKIVCIGYPIDSPLATLRRKRIIDENEITGEYKDGNLTINSLLMNSGLKRWKATEALKVNGLLDNIILHYRDWEDVKNNGLGFDTIDYLFVTKEQMQDKENMKIIKKHKRKGFIKNIKKI